MSVLGEINFHNNYIMLGEYFLNLDSKTKEQYTRALTEIYFYANSLRLENRQAKQELSKWQSEYYQSLKTNNNGTTIHIS